MKRLICMYAFLLCLVCVLPAQEREVKLKIVQTSDVHGNYFPYNFITQKEWGGSLARVYALVQRTGRCIRKTLYCWITEIFCKDSLRHTIIII